MWSSKDVYYLSDGTGITAQNLGQALTCQFPEINFHEEKFPFIRTVAEAIKIREYILKQSIGRRPLLFSTIMDPEVRKVFDAPEVEFFDVYEKYLERLESCLEAKALRVPGVARSVNNMAMAKRVEAIHFCLEHDDGTHVETYDQAEVILLGVSRAGKTPVSVYLATQMGLRSANFPLTAEVLNTYRLPPEIARNMKKVIGLTTTPEFLHSSREKRYSGSTYAKINTCREEIRQAEQIYLDYKIPVISSAGKSIEETSTQISQELGFSRKPGTLNT
jgi:hypothetical protein